MMILKADIRKKDKEAKKVYSDDMIPAVFYGPKEKSTSIIINKIDFSKILDTAGETTTITINMPGKDIEVLIQEVQRHPVSMNPIHVDFYAPDLTKEVEVAIPIEFINMELAIKNGIETIVKVLHEITVRALPKDLPHKIIVDISNLKNIEDNIVIEDIKLPNGVIAINKPDDVIVSAAASKEEEEEKEEISTEDALANIKVEKKGKEEGQEEVETKEEEKK